MLGTATASLGVLLVTAAPSYAGGGLQRCLDQAVDHNGEPPVCTKVDGTWVASWPSDDASSGVGGGMFALVVLGFLVGLAILVWKVSAARTLARRSGMDEGIATQMTLLTDDGLEATYLASSLRGPDPDQPTAAEERVATPPAGATAPVSARLQELKGLLDRGLVTQAEYDERRKAIIDSV